MFIIVVLLFLRSDLIREIFGFGNRCKQANFGRVTSVGTMPNTQNASGSLSSGLLHASVIQVAVTGTMHRTGDVWKLCLSAALLKLLSFHFPVENWTLPPPSQLCEVPACLFLLNICPFEVHEGNLCTITRLINFLDKISIL